MLCIQDASSDALAKTKDAYEGFLGSPDNLKAVRQQLQVRTTEQLSHQYKSTACVWQYKSAADVWQYKPPAGVWQPSQLKDTSPGD